MQKCDKGSNFGFGKEQIYAQDVHAKNTNLWTNFTADWIVPELPEDHAGQVDYHWSGFKSEQPEMGYPVLQPVLQYGQTGRAMWQLQSWYVWGDGNKAVTAPAVSVSPGDKLNTFMGLEDGVWTIYGENERTGEKSVLTIKKDALGCDCDFEWAMLVHETITSKTKYCDTYPSSDTIAYSNVMGDRQPFVWTERVQKDDCTQAINVDGTDITFTWDHSA